MQRREIARVLIASAAGAALITKKAKAQTCTAPCFAQTAAETAAGVTPTNLAYTAIPIDVRRYGVVPNNPGAATANTTALKALLNPTKTGPTGQLIFPNTTGADIYYFNGVIPIRDGIHIDLMGCTIDYTATASATDVNSGLFYALRNFSCVNGSISVAVNTSSARSSGYAVQIGARASDSSYFTVYDSYLASPMGNVTLKDLHITLANTGSNLLSSGGIGMLGGLQNVVIENVTIDGGGNVGSGIAYEFGWATTGTANLRQTSHARNMKITNLMVRSLDATSGIGLIIAGAYSCFVDGLYVSSAASVVFVTTGESLFNRPWTGVDTVGARHTVALRNLVGQRLHGLGVALAGAQLASGGYLASLIAALGHPGDYLAETDLGDFSLDGFALDGSGNPGNGWGISISGAARVDIRNGSISGGFQRGIVATDETINFTFDGVRIFGCQQNGIQLDVGAPIWSPARLKKGEIKNCYIAGNGTGSAGTFPAISVDTCQNIFIANNRLGYESGFAGISEATQGNGVQLGSAAQNVICDGNHVSAGPGAVAYHNALTTAAGCAIRNASGTMTANGSWEREGMGFGTATNIADKTHALNTNGKYFGRRVFDTSNRRLMVALGPTATSNWEIADGSGSVTPA
jgi:hypothetical protein